MPKNIKDDFFASDYSDEFEDNKNEFPEDNVNCPCDSEALDKEWNLQLSEEEIDSHRFMISTLDPLIKKLIVPVDYYDAMATRFVKTFEKNAGVLPGHRNS